MEPAQERRADMRYRLRAPVIFNFIGSDALLVQGAGFIKDISTSGVFVITQTITTADQNLEIEVFMPQVQQFNFSLRSFGRVIRTQYAVGFAAVGNFSFHRVGQ